MTESNVTLFCCKLTTSTHLFKVSTFQGLAQQKKMCMVIHCLNQYSFCSQSFPLNMFSYFVLIISLKSFSELALHVLEEVRDTFTFLGSCDTKELVRVN